MNDTNMSDTRMSETYALSVERTIRGPIDAVFDAWLNADTLKKFMKPGPGMSVPSATTDPRVGGRFHIVMKDADREIPHQGEYRVIERPHRLVFTWVSEPAGNSLVTLDFQKLTERSTRVTLTHEKLASEMSRDGHRSGWTAILDSLEHVVA
jgi:uncharacterized protein YndB with AHSA1/START domain